MAQNLSYHTKIQVKTEVLLSLFGGVLLEIILLSKIPTKAKVPDGHLFTKLLAEKKL